MSIKFGTLIAREILRMILIIIGFLILILILNKTSYARKHSEECHMWLRVMWEVYEVKGVLGFGVLLRYRGLSWEPLEAQILQYTSKFFTIKKTTYPFLFIKHLPPHLLPIRLLAFGHFCACFSTCSHLLLCVLHMCLLTLSYIHKHTNEFHRLHERHIAYVSINTIIYNG